MKSLQCIIIDDEPLARQGLKGYVDKIPFLEEAGIFKSAMAAQSFLGAHTVDLMFLDIEMPDLTGIQFLKSQPSLPPVILTTAYAEYALEGYQFDVIDYLLKPISFERFLQAANKASRFLSMRSPTSKTNEEYLFVKTDDGLEKVIINEILFVESMQNYITIYTHEKKYLTLVPLKRMEEWLPENGFLKVHKSFVVAKNKVEGILGNQIMMGKNRIPISERKRKGVLDQLTKDRFLKK